MQFVVYINEIHNTLILRVIYTSKNKSNMKDDHFTLQTYKKKLNKQTIYL